MSRLSDFWLTEDDWIFDNIDDVESDENENTTKLIKLSAARRAVSNYVYILTNKNIPVIFSDKNMVNCTDGKSVFLSGNVTKEGKFDVAVGLALHEASHIVYSDIELLVKTLWGKIPKTVYKDAEKLNLNKDETVSICKDIINYVEDRFIDFTVYKNAPGYRGYYKSLYDEYFDNELIGVSLRSKLYTIPTIDSYLYRIINLTNISTDLNALPKLKEIAKILDLTNISRLKTQIDRINVGLEIAQIVFSESIDYKKKNNKTSSDEDGDKLLGGLSSSSKNENDQKIDDNQITDNGDDSKISVTKQLKIKKSFEKQKSFLRGDIQKSKVSKREKELLDVLEKSQIEVQSVAKSYTESIYNIPTGIECVLVKNMTKELLLSKNCPIGTNEPEIIAFNAKSVNEGISMGFKIGRKLQVRNEINTIKFSRRHFGKLDKRLLHEFGYLDGNIFYTNTTEKYKDINFHISVDASTSMGGEKWKKTMKLCVALAKAASMLNNIHITISFRSTINNKTPYIIIAYDSKKDKFDKVKNLFQYLIAGGTTPEGLCYESIIQYLPKNDSQKQSYFLNISDGEPAFKTIINKTEVMYSGVAAAKHTCNQVKQIKKAGYEVLSYFIEEHSMYNIQNSSYNNFKIMYGNDAQFIDVHSINQIVNTLNKKFMQTLDI